MSTRSVLGKGVGALLPDNLDDPEEARYFYCDIDKISPNPNQPRTFFEQTALDELAESIRDRGVIQPLLVTRTKEHRYELVAGERRLRASKQAGLEEVPVVVIDEAGPGDKLELALIENIQRQDLNPIEEAMAYGRLISDFSLTQEQAAAKVGKNRSTITNSLRLLQLPDYLRADVVEGRLTEGHARVFLRLKEDLPRMREMRDRVVGGCLTVRQTENLLKTRKPQPATRKQALEESEILPDSYCRVMATRLINHLNTQVRIVQNGTRGRIEVEYYSSDDLDRLMSLLAGE